MFRRPIVIEDTRGVVRDVISPVAGLVGKALGDFNEDTVLDICRALVGERRCSFLLGEPRLARPDEDARGIDVVCDSDIGPLYLQVKSSKSGLRKFRAKHVYGKPRASREIIGAVVVDNDDIIGTAEHVARALQSAHAQRLARHGAGKRRRK